MRNIRYASAMADPGSLKVANTAGAAGGEDFITPLSPRGFTIRVAGISARTGKPSVSWARFTERIRLSRASRRKITATPRSPPARKPIRARVEWWLSTETLAGIFLAWPAKAGCRTVMPDWGTGFCLSELRLESAVW